MWKLYILFKEALTHLCTQGTRLGSVRQPLWGPSHQWHFFFFFFNIFYYYVFSSITFRMLSQKSPIPSPPLPYPPIPIFWPWHSPVLGHIKFVCPMGLSFQWWTTRPSFDNMQLESRAPGYWLSLKFMSFFMILILICVCVCVCVCICAYIYFIYYCL